MSSEASFSEGNDSWMPSVMPCARSADGGARIGEVTDQHPAHLLVRPGFSREITKSAPGDAAGGAIVGPVERRAGQRIDQRQRRDGGGGETAGDLRIGLGIGVVFDQQVDFGGNRRLGIGDGAGGVAGIVEIEHVDRQGARRQLEAAPHIGTGEAEPLQRHTRRLIEIGEGDTVAPRLGPPGPRGAEAAGEHSGQEKPAPQHRRR